MDVGAVGEGGDGGVGVECVGLGLGAQAKAVQETADVVCAAVGSGFSESPLARGRDQGPKGEHVYRFDGRWRHWSMRSA